MDLWIPVLILGINLAIAVRIFSGEVSTTFAVIMFFILVVIPIFFVFHIRNIIYQIDDKRYLRILWKPFYNETIDIQTISSIWKSRSAISAPAASLDRIAIRYEGYRTLILSPADKEEFIRLLREINPGIKVKLD